MQHKPGMKYLNFLSNIHRVCYKKKAVNFKIFSKTLSKLSLITDTKNLK